jgi:hypothetical protein
MARARASDARAAFGRVGTAQVSPAGIIASVSASNNASDPASVPESVSASVSGSPDAGDDASAVASATASLKASRNAGPLAGGRRRVGRPRGPARRALSIRILAENDDRLTAAVEATGQSPQYLVDAALTAYFDGLGIAARRG